MPGGRKPLSAISMTKGFEEGQRRTSGHIVNHIFGEVQQYFPLIKKGQERLQELFNKVVSPAVKLATIIQTSSSTYESVPKMETFFHFGSRIFTQQDLSIFKLVDVATGKTLKPDSPVQPNEEGQIGTPIMILAPALYRQEPGQDALLRVKQVVLVQLFKPLGRRRANTRHQKPRQDSGVSLI